MVGEIVRQVGQLDPSGDWVPRDAADVRLVWFPIASREAIQRFDGLVGIAQAVQVIERVRRVLDQVMQNGNDLFDVRLDL
jgi:hypothetical protein